MVRSILNDAADEDSEDEDSYQLDGIPDEGSDKIDAEEEEEEEEAAGADDSGIDEDFQGDLAKELYDITRDMEGTGKDLESVERFASYDRAGEPAGVLTRSRKRRKRKGLGLQGDGVLELLEEGDDQFTGRYHNPLLDRYYQDEPAQPSPNISKKGRKQKVRVGTSLFKIRKLDASGRRSRQNSSASMKSVRFEGEEVETPATIREVQGSESEDDEDFEPEAALVSSSVESNKENVQPANLGEYYEVVSHSCNFVPLRIISDWFRLAAL